MTTWLWIIGITAIIWPAILTYVIDNHYYDRTEEINKGTQNKLTADLWQGEAKIAISNFEKIIEQQDSLIAILWHKVYGFRPDDGDRLIYSWKNYPNEIFGKAPEWTTTSYQEEFGDNRIERNDPFPWGTKAERLHFPD